MKVGIDTLPLKTVHKYRGIGIYTQNLIKALSSLKENDLELKLIEEKKELLKTDLIHYPYFDLFFRTLPLIKKKKTIVTIHDVIPLVFPSNFPKGIKGSLRLLGQRLALKNVSAVITDSHNSKRDINKYLDYPLKNIYVVYLACSSEFKQIEQDSLLKRVKDQYKLPERFILYVGDINYNKNVLGLIKAFGKLKTKRQNKDLKLVLVGKAFKQKGLKELKEIKNLIGSLSLEKYVKILGWLDNKDLVGIYNLAAVYCQPSFYEGFGLPVLEAMSCGTPVVAANTSSLPEISSEAAIMVDPYSINSIAKGLSSVLDNPLTVKMLSKRGLKQAENFSWEKVAYETYGIYQKLV